MNFWQQLKKPIFALAPMEAVTDCAFREMFARYSVQGPRIEDEGLKLNPFVMFTEFVNVDGLLHPDGRKKLEVDLQFTEIQRPIVAQLWGTDPEKFAKAAELVASLGFDGIDINMGCPQSKEIQIGACAALIRQPQLAQEIIRAAKRGAGSLPVSVKTRLGYSKIDEMEDWIKNLLDTEPAAITLHGRTKQEMSKVPAHWDRIADAVKVRDGLFPSSPRAGEGGGEEGLRPLILGNGDIESLEDGLGKVSQTGVDGIMIGRGAFGNPWIFRRQGESPAPQERLRVMLEHAELFEEMYKGTKPFQIMRKHFKAYCSGFPGAHELRAKLMETESTEETRQIVEQYLQAVTA